MNQGPAERTTTEEHLPKLNTNDTALPTEIAMLPSRRCVQQVWSLRTRRDQYHVLIAG
jgi:hypothetical protein